jgi:hypothetical protein
MEQLENTSAPRFAEGATLIETLDLNPLKTIDYASGQKLVSDRLKLVFEMFMPKLEFIPVVFSDKKDILTFYKFTPPLYEHCIPAYRIDNTVSRITFLNGPPPVIFTTKPQKNTYSAIVHLSVAESVLRRRILGLRFTKL